jgi:hypothetical protein
MTTECPRERLLIVARCQIIFPFEFRECITHLNDLKQGHIFERALDAGRFRQQGFAPFGFRDVHLYAYKNVFRLFGPSQKQ